MHVNASYYKNFGCKLVVMIFGKHDHETLLKGTVIPVIGIPVCIYIWNTWMLIGFTLKQHYTFSIECIL